MDRIDRIINNGQFQYHLQENRRSEIGRRFCCHEMTHFLDVARIGQIINLEEQIGLARDWIYAAALLHDLGKHLQYENGVPHEEGSARIAPDILRDCGFDEEEETKIVDAIRNHRNAEVAGERNLRGVLYRADKASRPCFSCEAASDCNWKGDKKNLQIKY